MYEKRRWTGLLAIVFFYIVILAVGIWAGRKTSHKDGDGTPIGEGSHIMLAGRNIGHFVGIFTMTATWVGGGYINGTAEIIYTQGLVWCQAPFGYAISLIIGGQLFAAKMRNAGYKTMLDPFQQHYGARIGGLLFVPALCGEVFWSAAILAALGSTVKVVMDLNQRESVIASACVALFYTLTGGLYSVAYTDVVQLGAIVFGLWLCIPFILSQKYVGKVNFPSNDYVGSLDWGQFGAYWDSMLLLMMGGVPWQVYFQRVLSSKTAEGAELLSYMASFGCVLMAVPPVVIGAAAKVANFTALGYSGRLPLSPDEASLVLPLSLQYLTPPLVSAIGLGAVSAAVMSSSDSSILSAASMFAWNIYKLSLRQSASDKEVICVMRVAILLVGALATLMALTARSVYSLWSLSSDLVYVILFPQLVCVVYFKDRTNAYGAVAAYIVAVVFRAVGGDSTLGIPVILKYPFFSEHDGQRFPFKTFAMMMSFVTLICSSVVFKSMFLKLPPKYDIFNCFDKLDRRKSKTSLISSRQQSIPGGGPEHQADVVPAIVGPVQQGPVQQGPVQQGPVQQGPVQQGPVQQGPVQQGPVQQGPVLVEAAAKEMPADAEAPPLTESTVISKRKERKKKAGSSRIEGTSDVASESGTITRTTTREGKSKKKKRGHASRQSTT
ncbi:high-affinity choline transporter 1-like isoform X1 [Ornithodoros turicata]|uniref:high-affinity choline transporter 1-like isoform X1 n=1 Tax=Ornithodoros turicata TaxID=34597 RepID=UPI00313A0684